MDCGEFVLHSSSLTAVLKHGQRSPRGAQASRQVLALSCAPLGMTILGLFDHVRAADHWPSTQPDWVAAMEVAFSDLSLA